MTTEKFVDSPCLTLRKRKYPDDLRELFQAARVGNGVALRRVLRQMDAGERTSALNAKWCNGKGFQVRTYHTLLITVTERGNLNCVKTLLCFKADIEGQGQVVYQDGHSETYTALHVAAAHRHLDVLKFLIDSEAYVDVLTNDNCTPLMIASERGHMGVVNFLVDHGANINLRDKQGDTAFHYAVRSNFSEAVEKLLTLGADQLYNNQRLTPLLLACNKGLILMVEFFLRRQAYSKEEKIDALELLGASLATSSVGHFPYFQIPFNYMKWGMEERFKDPSNPLPKKTKEPSEGYLNRKESQTCEELAWIEGDRISIIMEGLIVRERILGEGNSELLTPIRSVVKHIEKENLVNSDICRELRKNTMTIARHCNQSAMPEMDWLSCELYKKVLSTVCLEEKDFVQLLEQLIIECEIQEKLRREIHSKSWMSAIIFLSEVCQQYELILACVAKLIETIVKFTSCMSKTHHWCRNFAD